MNRTTEYVMKGGGFCPTCRSINLVSSNFRSEEGTATQDQMCCECGQEWTDVYTLIRIEHSNAR